MPYKLGSRLSLVIKTLTTSMFCFSTAIWKAVRLKKNIIKFYLKQKIKLYKIYHNWNSVIKLFNLELN